MPVLPEVPSTMVTALLPGVQLDPPLPPSQMIADTDAALTELAGL
jgi:hypothetical protein